MNVSNRLEVAISAAVAAGSILIKHYNDTLTVGKKESLRDVVTAVDELTEKTILEIIARAEPSACILSEECGMVNTPVDDRYWVVDALDGSANYVCHVPLFGVSVAYMEGPRHVVGVVYNPLSSDLYYGADGVGVFKNQNSLAVRDKSVSDGLFGMAFSGKNYDPANRKNEFLLMQDVNDSSRGCLRTGSAAMNLAFVAEGRFAGCLGKANKI